MKKLFRSVIFDMDGLLLDSERPIRDAWLQVCSEFGSPINEAAYQGAIGRNARDSRAHMVSVCNATFDYELAAARVSSMLQEKYEKTGYPLKIGALELLTWLRQRGIPLAVASSSSHAEVARRLKDAGIAGFFGAIAGGDEVVHGKPAPDLYELANERLSRIAPAHCLVFEDSEPGAVAGISAGMNVVIVPDIRPPSKEVTERSAGTVQTLQDAIVLCESWLGVA